MERRPNDRLTSHLSPAVTVLSQTYILPVHTNIHSDTLSSELGDRGQGAIKVNDESHPITGHEVPEVE
jgi:hypothetical protein